MTFAIDIGGAGAGWVGIDLTLGEQTFEMWVSDVANDPLRELADLALFVARGDLGEARATFWLEPEGYELRAVRDSALVLAVRHSRRAFATLQDPRLVLEREVEWRPVASELARALRAMLAVPPPRWRYELPAEQIVALEAMLRRR